MPDSPFPSAWLETAALPVIEVSEFVRIHRSAFGPLHFGPAKGQEALNRFDCESGDFRTMYCADGFDGALVETVVRNPTTKLIDPAELRSRSVSRLRAKRQLRLAKMTGEGLQLVGADNSISTGPYEESRRWSRALWEHRDEVDGLAYHSRHDPSCVCFAIWCRAENEFEIVETETLVNVWPKVMATLERYGKILIPQGD